MSSIYYKINYHRVLQFRELVSTCSLSSMERTVMSLSGLGIGVVIKRRALE
jgi:hypothetical protein